MRIFFENVTRIFLYFLRQSKNYDIRAMFLVTKALTSNFGKKKGFFTFAYLKILLLKV